MNDLVLATNEISSLARDKALGLVDKDLSVSKQEAQLSHFTLVELGKITHQAGLSLRDIAAKMYLTQQYKELEVYPYDDKSIPLMFEDFQSWIYYAFEEAGLSDKSASALKNYIEFLVDPVAKRLIFKSNNEAYTVEEVLSIPEGHSRLLASASRKTLRDASKDDDEKYDTLGKIISVATTSTGEELEEYLHTAGLKGRQNTPFVAEKAYSKNGNRVIYMISVDESLEPQVNTALNGRSDIRSATIDEIIADLMDMQSDDPDDVSDSELDEFLEGI